MYSNVQWRIARWFVGLSAAVYLVPTALALVTFYVSLTASIDRELEGFMASFGHAINVEKGKPVLRDWARIVQTNPVHSLVAYQLFDSNGRLLEAHFPPGIPTLFTKQHEVTANGVTMRTRMTALTEGKEVIGYLQVQLPTRSRDDAVRQLALIMAVAAPMVLAGLGFTSYLVAEKATMQTRQTLAMLRRFIADASHELYTPLSIVQAANESLGRAAAAAGVGATELEISESALDRMEKMVEDLMVLSNAETPELTKGTQLVDLQDLLAGIVNEFRPKFDQKLVMLSVTTEGKPRVRGDLHALQRMFANLIENAWRYTEPGGKVLVRLSRNNQYARVTVSDTGIGIPNENLPHIFDRFYRVDSSRSRSSGGSGLGLSIALAITEAHEGTIEAESEPGRGSTFKVKLPLDRTSG